MKHIHFKKKPSLARKMTKLLAVVVGIVILLLIVPFLIDFSSFKPQIQALVSNQVNAEIDFESARLQLIPSIGIQLKKVSIKNTDPIFNAKKMFSVDRLLVEAKLLPLISGKVVGNVRIEGPEIVIAQSGLKNNLTALAKPATAKATTSPAATNPSPSSITTAPPPAASTSSSTSNSMDTVKERLLIEGIYIDHASLIIRELSGGEKSEPVKIEDLNLAVKNIGLDRDISIDLSTNVNVDKAGARVAGTIVVNKIVHVVMGAAGLQKASFKGKLSFDDLDINFKDAFVKKRSLPLNVEFAGSYLPNEFILDQLIVNVHTLALQAQAHVVDFAAPKLTAKIQLANDHLASLGDLLPKHKDMLMNGKMHLNASANGGVADLGTLQTVLDFDTQLTGTDMTVHLDTSGVMPFKGHLNMASHKIDLDALAGPFLKKTAGAPASDSKSSDPNTSDPQKPAASSTAPATASSTASAPSISPPSTSPPSTTAPKTIAKDFALTDEQKKLIVGTNAEVRVDLKEVKYAALSLKNIKIDLDQKNFQAALKQFNIDGFGGKITANGHFDLNQNPIPFDMTFKASEIHPELVMLVVQPEHKNVMVGRANFDLALKGKGSTVPTLNKTLNGHGAFKFLDGELHTKSIAAAMNQQVDQFISTLSVSGAGSAIFDAADKLLKSPLAKLAGKNPPDLAKLKEQYSSLGKVKLGEKASTNRSLKDVSGQIEIRDGKIYIVSKTSDPSGVLDLKSYVDLQMNLGGTAIFTASESTKTNLKSQSAYADLVFDDKNNLVVPITLGGTVMDPKVSIGTDAMKAGFSKKAQALVEREVKKAAEDYMKKAMGGDAQKAQANQKVEEAKQKAKDALANPENQQKAKDALKGLFGN